MQLNYANHWKNISDINLFDSSSTRKLKRRTTKPYPRWQILVLCLSSVSDFLPQVVGDVADVLWAGDWGAVKTVQVGEGEAGPALGLQVNQHQLLLC